MLHYAVLLHSAALASGSTNGILSVRSPVAGVISRVEVVVEAGNGAGAAIFDVNLNGTTIFTDQDTRPEIAAGDISASVGGLAEPVAHLAPLSVDADNIPAGGFPAKSLTLIITIDDGVTMMLTPDEVAKSLYAGAFDRAPDSTELSNARAAFRIASLTNTAAFIEAVRDLGHTLFISAEYIARGRSDAEFVGDLYRAYLGREPDADGLADWLAVITGGATRTATDTAFSGATEFTEIRSALMYGGTTGARGLNPMTAAGDLIVGGTGGAETRLPKGTNGQLLSLAGGSPVWADAPASGGGPVAPFDSTHPDAAPAVPNAADDEFLSSGLDTAGTRRAGATAWAIVNQGSALIAQAGSHLLFSRTTDDGALNLHSIVQALLSSVFKYRCKIDIAWKSGNALAGMLLRDSVSGKAYVFNFSTGTSLQLNVTTFNSNTATPIVNNSLTVPFAPTMYLEIEQTLTMRYWRRSLIGVEGSFVEVHSESVATHLTPNQIGVGIAPITAPMIASFDWFRRIS